MKPLPKGLLLNLPPHLLEVNEQLVGRSIPYQQLMRQLVEFGHFHIQHHGCGPFVAAIQEIATDSVLVVGANVVVLWRQSWAHAERVAIALAQERLDSHALTRGKYRLLTTAQMCIACYGECLTSGFGEIVASATVEDIETLTQFGEGVLPEDWVEHLRRRGTKYIPDVERSQGQSLLAAYGKEGIGYFDAGSARNSSARDKT